METIQPFSSVTSQRSAQDLRNEALQLIQKMRKPDAQSATPAALSADNQKPQEFSATLSHFIQSVNTRQNMAISAQQQYAAGDSNVSLTDSVLSTQKASMEFQLLASVRNKAISAYKEIMNMPI